MSNTAYIRDIASLEQLRIAIARFCEESENQLQTIDSKMQSRIGNLKSLESQFQRMIETAQDDLRSANSSLSSCESNNDEEGDGNTTYPECDSELELVIDCRKRLELAEHNYNSFKREFRNLEKSIAEYQNPKVKYRTLIQFEKEAATSSLKQLINGAEDYLSVSSPLNNGFGNELGLTEAVAKIDPTMIFAATVGVAEIIVMSMFSFLGLGGNLFNLSNKSKNGLVKTTYTENGTKHICSELKIEKRETGNIGKIVSVNIPLSLQNEKVGKHLIYNMEATCRANDCKEISGWANSFNVGFYQGLNYQTRNEIKETGAEVFKSLESNFFSSQQKAKATFRTLNDEKIGKSRVQVVNPLHIITPVDFNDDVFWHQHIPEGRISYMQQIEGYIKCKELIKKGKTLDELKRDDFSSAIAYENFIHKTGGDTIRLQKHGDYFRVAGGGRHRVTAAQLYYLQTGIIVQLTTEVEEIF